MDKFGRCHSCGNTGILRATLVEGEEGNHIEVVVCGGHFDHNVAEKNMVAMHDATGLDIDILRVEKPTPRRE